MSLIILTPPQRRLFAAYCEQEAKTETGMLEQMEKMGAGGLLGDSMGKVFKTRILGYSIVAKELLWNRT